MSLNATFYHKFFSRGLPLLIAGVVTLGAATRAHATDTKPNILLIIADDMGYEYRPIS